MTGDVITEAKQRGKAALQRGNFEGAIEAYQAVVAETPDDVEAWQFLGSALGSCGRYDDAVQAFRNAQHLLPQSPRILYNLALAFEGNGQPDAARESLEKALALDPDYDMARSRLALLTGAEVLPDDNTGTIHGADSPAAVVGAPSDDLAAVGGVTVAADELSSVGGPESSGPAATSAAPVAATTTPPSASYPPGYAPPPVLTGPYAPLPGMTVGDNTSGDPNAIVPPEVNKWNWGAFFLSFLWLVNHRMVGWGIGLLVLSFIPFVGVATIGASIYLGLKGSELGWRHRRFASVDDFKACQRTWAIWGICTFVLGVVLGILGAIFRQNMPGV